jgi:hypothetical protein
MKTMKFIQKASISLIALAVVTYGIQAQGGGPFTKEIKKEYAVNPNTRLEVFNKYGNVDITSRNDAVLSIQVVIKVDVRDQQRADDLFGMIKIDITQEGDLIKAVTDIGEDFGRYFKGFNTDNGGLEINYRISMPASVPVNLSNKYGNVFIDELTSTSTIDVKYGKLTANKILHDSKEPLTKVYLSYSNGTIQETRWIELDIKYSKINITQCKALAVLSKYSKVFVNNASSVVSESKYDTYEIGKLNNFITTASYGHFTIQELSGKLQVDSKYTDVIIDRIPVSFEGVKITNSYGTCKLGIDPAAAYKLNAYTKYCNIVYPENNAKVNRFNENNEMKVNGVIGNAQNAKAEVNVTSHYGNIRLVP